MANNLFFPAIQRYDTITSSDWITFYPIVADRNKYDGGIDGLPRKITMGSLLTFIENNANISATSQFEVKDEGVSLGTSFTKLNFTGPFVKASDATGGEAKVSIQGNLIADLTDVSTKSYLNFADLYNGVVTDWITNKPVETSNVNWYNNFKASTYGLIYDPVNDTWRASLLNEVLDYLAYNVYVNDGYLTGDRKIGLSTFGFEITSAAVTNTFNGYTSTVGGGKIKFYTPDHIRVNGSMFNDTATDSQLNIGFYADDTNYLASRVDRSIYIDFYAVAGVGYSGESARLIRNTGTNGNFTLINSVGTGLISFQQGTGGTTKFNFNTSGQLQATKYGVGTFTGTATYTLQVDASGNIIEGALGAADTNFAANDLTFSGARTHDISGNSLIIQNGVGVNILDINITSSYSLFGWNASNWIKINSNSVLLEAGGVQSVSLTSTDFRSTVPITSVNSYLTLENAAGNKVRLQSPSSFTTYTLVFPTTDGTETNQALVTDGAGTLSWKDMDGMPAGSVTTTTYTLVLGDKGTMIEASNASAITITVPPTSSVAFPTGTMISFTQRSAGQLTLAPGTGVTLSNANGLKTASQYSVISLWKSTGDTWYVFGDTTV